MSHADTAAALAELTAIHKAAMVNTRGGPWYSPSRSQAIKADALRAELEAAGLVLTLGRDGWEVTP